MYASPGSICGSKKNTVLPMTEALAPTSWSISFACTSRGHGQRPMLAIDCSSTAITATLSDGLFEEAFTPRS